jgi:choline dehydrogenase-like flavoprotein
MGLTKVELVEYVRMAEHNQDVAEETLRQQAENVKDWMPVVRCKDCVYWNRAMVNAKGFLICKASGMEIMAHDYCSYGERKDT